MAVSMKMKAVALADELEHDYATDAVEEGVARAEEAIEQGRRAEAQLWMSAIFILLRRRGHDGPEFGRLSAASRRT